MLRGEEVVLSVPRDGSYRRDILYGWIECISNWGLNESGTLIIKYDIRLRDGRVTSNLFHVEVPTIIG